MSGGNFDYDIDDFGHDDFEFAMDDMDGGLFDSYEDKKPRPAGQGSVYERPQPLDLRELLDDNGDLRADAESLLETLPEDEVEELVIESSGFPNVWDAYMEHAYFFEPANDQYQKDRQYERYWDCPGYERARSRISMRELYQRNPERARTYRQQRDKKAYHVTNPEGERARKRENNKRWLSKLTEEQQEAKKAKQREAMRKLRAQRRADKNG